jgi:2-methylcitrate dehydratase PrpD
VVFKPYPCNHFTHPGVDAALRLRVTTRTGEELEARVEVNRGGPGNPLSDEELARKFHDNAVRSLPEERAAELAARTLALPDAQSVEDLTALLTSAGER